MAATAMASSAMTPAAMTASACCLRDKWTHCQHANAASCRQD
jgi:hypothetical protein